MHAKFESVINAEPQTNAEAQTNAAVQINEFESNFKPYALSYLVLRVFM